MSGRPEVKEGENVPWDKYIVHKKVTEKELQQSRLDYINRILQTNLLVLRKEKKT